MKKVIGVVVVVLTTVLSESAICTIAYWFKFLNGTLVLTAVTFIFILMLETTRLGELPKLQERLLNVKQRLPKIVKLFLEVNQILGVLIGSVLVGPIIMSLFVTNFYKKSYIRLILNLCNSLLFSLIWMGVYSQALNLFGFSR